jgi:hypothetical protein
MGLFRKETALFHGCAGCAILVGVSLFLLGIGMYLDPSEGKTQQDSVSGFALGAMVAVPGLIAWFFVVRHNKVVDFREAVLGMIRNHERFTVPELAQKIGRTELETERLIAVLSQRNKDLTLVFHRPSRQYMHQGVLQSSATVVESCPKCGAPQGRQAILAGETANCTHCDARLI